ncbi:MAG: hypothetical protein GY856_41035 [bacterium]|nr:hypothetical protein [bacterium]
MNKTALSSVAVLAGFACLVEPAETRCWGGIVENNHSIVSQSNCPNSQPFLTRTLTVTCIDACGHGASSLSGSATGFGQCVSDETCGSFTCLAELGEKFRWQTEPTIEIAVYNRIGSFVPGHCEKRICGRMERNVALLDCPCEEDWNPRDCGEQDPLIVSLQDRRYLLTDRSGGVVFDVDDDGKAEQVPWTRPGADDAFLVLDRDGNGTIDNGRELFGDITPQHHSDHPNGFLALALFDDALNGGNEDGRIDEGDQIFEHLRLWHDMNHNGHSEADELFSLGAVGIEWFDLDYHHAGRVDQHGNQFRYWARSGRSDGTIRTVWNVFLTAD